MAKFNVETKFTIERGDDEFDVDVKAIYYLPTKSYFNPMLGEGHPGEPAEVEIISVKYKDKEIELTEKEIDKLTEQILDEEADSNDDDVPEWDDDKDW